MSAWLSAEMNLLGAYMRHDRLNMSSAQLVQSYPLERQRLFC